MLDSYARSPYQALLVEPIARRLTGVPPNVITLAACAFGLATLPLLAFSMPLYAVIAMVISGYLDTLDGSIARIVNQTSNKGTVLDILSDRAVESAIIIGLFLAHPGRGLLCLLMLASTLLCITSFLVVGIFSENDSEKSFHYSPGLVERAEAFLFFGVMILLPTLFTPLALLFSALVLLTALIRAFQFISN